LTLAGKFDLKMCEDELLIVHDRAVRGYEIRNICSEDLVLFKYFGPDIQKGRTPPSDKAKAVGSGRQFLARELTKGVIVLIYQ
jgi:hypothetical protein